MTPTRKRPPMTRRDPRLPGKQQSPEAIYGPRRRGKPVRTEAEHTRAYPKDRALALAIVRLAHVEANTVMPEETLRRYVTATLDEIAKLSCVLALNIEEVRDAYRNGPVTP